MIIGYARVSTKEQNLARQIKELKEYGCEEIFTEKQSAKDFERPVYVKMKKKLRFQDVLVVHDLSRFGRNKEQIKQEWEELRKENIDIVVLDTNFLNTAQYKDIQGVGDLVSNIFLEVMAWMVEEERRKILENQRQGIAIAKAQGKYTGRKPQYSPKGSKSDMYYLILSLLDQGVSQHEIGRRLNISRSTVQRVKKNHENMEGK